MYTFKNKDIRELKNFYKNREVILGADYAILSHLHIAVQLCIKNAVTIFLEKPKYGGIFKSCKYRKFVLSIR